jgi:hypothetical protein
MKYFLPVQLTFKVALTFAPLMTSNQTYQSILLVVFNFFYIVYIYGVTGLFKSSKNEARLKLAVEFSLMLIILEIHFFIG